MQTPIRRILEAKGSAVRTTSAEATVIEAVRHMNEHGVGALVVCDEHKPVGMFSERDVLRRVVSEGRDPTTTKVAHVMTREVVVIHPRITVGEAMSVITQKRFRHLPVVEEGRIVGIISAGDLTKWVAQDLARDVQDLVEYIHGPHVRDSVPPATN